MKEKVYKFSDYTVRSSPHSFKVLMGEDLIFEQVRQMRLALSSITRSQAERDLAVCIAHYNYPDVIEVKNGCVYSCIVTDGTVVVTRFEPIASFVMGESIIPTGEDDLDQFMSG
jgi:hypothetical protein